MTVSRRLGGPWWFSFVLVTSLFVASLVIFGFDIPVKGDQAAYTKERALGGLIKNKQKQFSYYRIDESLAYMVSVDSNTVGTVIGVISYERNFFPMCFFCGYYADAIGKDAPEIRDQPDRKEILTSYEEMSFMGPDDEDCFIAFLSSIISYSILLVWGGIRLFLRKN